MPPDPSSAAAGPGGTSDHEPPEAPGAGPPATPPSGRDTTVAALVAAATRLFARKGPDGVSLRAVAAEAGVNYGLIHQYVGTKEDLLHLVFRSVSETAAEDVGHDADLDDVVARFVRSEPSPFVAMLAWALLQGRDGAGLLGRSPALATLVERADADAQAQAGPAADLDARVAAVTAISLGWQLFGPFIRAGLGRDDDPELTDQLRALARGLLEPDA